MAEERVAELEAEHRQVAASLARNEETLTALLDASPACCMLIDREGRLERMSRAGIEMMGLKEGTVSGSFVDLWPESFRPVVRRALERTFGHGTNHTFEAFHESPDGRTAIFSVMLGPLFDVRGEVRHVVGLSTDITTLSGAGQRLRNLIEGSDRVVPPISEREREVLGWLVHGKNTAGVAAVLGITERTVKFHVGNILRKLNATSRTHAVAIALDLGLVEKTASARTGIVTR